MTWEEERKSLQESVVAATKRAEVAEKRLATALAALGEIVRYDTGSASAFAKRALAAIEERGT